MLGEAPKAPHPEMGRRFVANNKPEAGASSALLLGSFAPAAQIIPGARARQTAHDHQEPADREVSRDQEPGNEQHRANAAICAEQGCPETALLTEQSPDKPNSAGHADRVADEYASDHRHNVAKAARGVSADEEPTHNRAEWPCPHRGRTLLRVAPRAGREAAQHGLGPPALSVDRSSLLLYSFSIRSSQNALMA